MKGKHEKVYFNTIYLREKEFSKKPFGKVTAEKQYKTLYIQTRPLTDVTKHALLSRGKSVSVGSSGRGRLPLFPSCP